MALHGLTALGTNGRLLRYRGGHGIHLALQRCQHAWPVLVLYFTLQFYERRDSPQGGTLRGRQGCGRGTRLNLFGQVSPALPWRTAATLQDDSAAPSPTRWLVEPTTRSAMFGHAVDKTKISITVLGPKVQHYRGPWTRGLGCRGSNPGPLRESRLRGRTRGRVPSSIKRRSHLPENVQAPCGNVCSFPLRHTAIIGPQSGVATTQRLRRHAQHIGYPGAGAVALFLF